MTCRSKSYVCLAMRSAVFIKFLPDRGAQCRAEDRVRFKNAVFFLKVSDHLLLVLLDPASDHRDQDMENHSCSSGGKPWSNRAIQYTPSLSNFNRVAAAEIFNHTGSANHPWSTRMLIPGPVQVVTVVSAPCAGLWIRSGGIVSLRATTGSHVLPLGHCSPAFPEPLHPWRSPPLPILRRESPGCH